MDISTFFTGGASGLTITAVIYGIYKVINHKHIRSRCCGTKIDIEVDVKDITPKENGTGDPPNTK